MKNVAEEVNMLGGVASKGSTSTHRPRWAQVKNALENGSPLPINCN